MNRDRISKANENAVKRILEADPIFVDVKPAIEVVPGMTDTTILHAGPPIEFERMCGPMKGGVAGALMLEGLAKTEEEAYELAMSGDITFDSCHNHDAVAPMTGIISASMPVMIVKNMKHGNYAYSTINEGRDKVLRFGALSDDVIDRLRWFNEVLGPELGKVIRNIGGFSVLPIMAEALQMGDDLHNRFKACSALFASRFLPALIDTIEDKDTLKKVSDFIGNNDYFYLNITMAGLKACMDAAHGIEYSTIVTTMTRNGTEFGIRVSGLPGEWFTVKASVPKTLYFPGYGLDDTNPDMGDSAIIETYGLGGFAAAASPIIVQSVGGTIQEANERTFEMYEITTKENPLFSIPAIDFKNLPVGIDLLKVLETNTVPVIHTGVAHKNAGVGQIGAGIVRPDINVFKDALRSYFEKYGRD
ncbi:MAG: DUF1116 domain-containing protein [Firmicutes bacterium]|nr:DUF1116 domain-containing protein [Bacillota bacterium]